MKQVLDKQTLPTTTAYMGKIATNQLKCTFCAKQKIWDRELHHRESLLQQSNTLACTVAQSIARPSPSYGIHICTFVITETLVRARGIAPIIVLKNNVTNCRSCTHNNIKTTHQHPVKTNDIARLHSHVRFLCIIGIICVYLSLSTRAVIFLTSLCSSFPRMNPLV